MVGPVPAAGGAGLLAAPRPRAAGGRPAAALPARARPGPRPVRGHGTPLSGVQAR